ncbi:MAG: hypothetical protein IPP68_04800 [Elusimicrobia bacterium]|nr:hypothetical protein [Elusimicrobiota bacterium]
MKRKFFFCFAATFPLFTAGAGWAVWPPEGEEKRTAGSAARAAEPLADRVARDEACLTEALRDLKDIKDQLRRVSERPKEK